MQPTLEIQTVQPALFTYSLGMRAQPGQPCGNFFDTAERCLQDAGRGLSVYFDTVQIRIGGFALGSYPVARMIQDPLGLFDELMARLKAIYRQRAVPRRPLPARAR